MEISGRETNFKRKNMALSKNNVVVKGLAGKLGKDVVFRTRGDKTFISKYPDMSNVVPTEEQLKFKSKFGEAVAYARSIINDPKKKAAFKVEEGKSVYHSAIREFMAKQVGQSPDNKTE